MSRKPSKPARAKKHRDPIVGQLIELPVRRAPRKIVAKQSKIDEARADAVRALAERDITQVIPPFPQLESDPIAYQAAHCVTFLDGVQRLLSQFGEQRSAAQKLAIFGFCAGAAHAAMVTEQRYRPAAQAYANRIAARRDEAAYRLKFDDDDLRAHLQAGMSANKIAEKYGISPQYVRRRRKLLFR